MAFGVVEERAGQGGGDLPTETAEGGRGTNERGRVGGGSVAFEKGKRANHSLHPTAPLALTHRRPHAIVGGLVVSVLSRIRRGG